jgi:hypothetical protein
VTQGDSPAPAAIAALVLMLKTSAELSAAGVLVLDGPEAFDGSAQSVIMVAAADDEDDTSTEQQLADEGYGGIRDRESTDIRCKLAVRYGDGPFAPVRAAAYVLLGAVRRAIIADPTLGKTVMTASISSAALRQDMTTGGPRAQLRFTVTCDAYTT